MDFLARRPKIILHLIEQKGKHGCHHGHKVGDKFDYDTERGQLCPMAAHVAFPYVEILRYGGEVPLSQDYEQMVFCCPDVDVINVFQIEVILLV
ncbi:Hypothetical protein LUCI_0909 [Lucifera butyrica]|uniref:TIGR04076 family protein n=1 Tax=Lucifera butyrica TaxID=1351585 RepID=A0A498R990_9FIRM|nr:TIGR04076 family protein [Lucifera butyrica]VBB05698.1 Hypothetical protein LUCI_0909 [Lucifera butyrica]